MIPCQKKIESQKADTSKKLLRKQYVSKQSTKAYKYKIAKVLLCPWAKKINTSLTQKDTMDRGAWIKNSERRHAGGLKKDKSPKAQKWKMAWEWGTNEYFCLPYVTILWCPS